MIPSFLNVDENKLQVPPYKVEAATISSPDEVMFKMAAVVAACPEEKERAPTPPSSSEILFSRILLVGFDNLV